MADIQRVVNAGDLLGEVPVWCARTHRLWWVDVLGPRLHSLDPSKGTHRIFAVDGRSLGSIALREAGGLVLAMNDGLYAFDPETPVRRPLVDPEPDMPEHRLNDGRCDRRGRFWVGSMSEKVFEPRGSLYRIDADLSVNRLFGDIIIPNSIAFSPDDRTLYFADTRRYTIWAFDLDIDEGTISNRRVFAETAQRRPGRPDGSCVDGDGFLWNAEYAGGRLVRYAPDGRIDRMVDLPVSHPTCCAFGGDSLDILFVTSASYPLTQEQRSNEPDAGGLFALDVGVRGLPEPLFMG